MHVKLLIFTFLFTVVQFSDETSFSCFLDNCSFAGHFCSWINDNSDDFDWLLNSGETMTQETGPSTDADGDGNEKKIVVMLLSIRVMSKYESGIEF